MTLPRHDLQLKTTICNCFRKAGMDSTLNVVSYDLDDKDPFLAADENMALQGLIDVVMTGCDHCPLEEYVNGEDDVPVCLDACSDTWEEEFFDNLGQEDQDEEDSYNKQQTTKPRIRATSIKNQEL